MSDQLHGDDPRQLRAEHILGKGSQGPEIIRVRLTSALASGGNATAAVVDYTGAGFTTSTRIVRVYDAMSLKSGASGDYLWAIWNVDARRFEVLGDSGEKINFKNNDATEAPAYASMEITGTTTTGGVTYVTVRKPSGSSSDAHYMLLVNGSSAVAASGTGIGYLANELPRRIKYNTGDGTPAFGEVWGNYTSNDWQARGPGSPGYMVLGDVSGGSFLGIKDREIRSVAAMYGASSVTLSAATVFPMVMTGYTPILNCAYDGSPNYKLTVRIAGMYAVSWSMSVKNNYSLGPLSKKHSTLAVVNGVTGAGPVVYASTYGAAWACMASTAIKYLEAGDYLQLEYDQDDTTDSSASYGSALTLHRIC